MTAVIAQVRAHDVWDRGVSVDIFQRIQDVFLLLGWIWAVMDKGSKE